MPVIKSAIKKMRQDIKRRQINRLRKERLKSLIKKSQKEPVEKNILAAISFVDKVAKTKIIHKKKAAHLKSQLAKLLVKNTRPSATKKKVTSLRKTTKSSAGRKDNSKKGPA